MLYYNPEQYSRLEFCSFVISKAANKVSVNFRGKVGHYRNGSLCYCFSLVGQHLYISSARKFNEATIVPFISFTSIGAVVIEPR